MKILLISIGVFQDYIIDSIKNLLLHDNNDITVITEKAFFHRLQNFINIKVIDKDDLTSSYIQDYTNNSSLNRIYRNGFWFNTSLRMFYVHAYMKQNDINDLIHIENDIMIYENLDNLKNCFKNDKVYFSFDCDKRAILSFIYIPNYKLLETILESYDYSKNDMENFGLLSENITEGLPIIDTNSVNYIHKINKNFNDFNCIFDAAAIGQYLGGIDKLNDPNDTRGFINETCIVKYNNYTFNWIYNDNTKLWYPFIKINNKNVKIINLHIHSKYLHNFLSNNPNECKLIPKMYDLIICVYCCDTVTKYKNELLKMISVYSSIIKKLPNIKILYFLGEEEVLKGDDFIHLKNVKNDYRSATFKQWYGLKYIYENYNTKFVSCIGTDTYTNIPKLVSLLYNYDYNKNLYIGGHGCHRTIQNERIYFHSGGPGFIISNKCLEIIYPYLNNIDDFFNNWKDSCGDSHLIDACDVHMGYLATYIKSEIIKVDGFYHCNYNGYPCCVSKFTYDKIISCHSMSSDDFDNFTKILQINNYFM